jgi:hypothetical protein
MSTAVAEPAAPVARRGWYRRNWKWATPLIVLLVVVGGGLIFAWPLLKPWMHEQYGVSLKEIKKHPKAIEKLGEPIETARLLPGGSITMEGDRGEASFNYDVKGPKGAAKVASRSRYMNGRWDITQLELVFDDDSKLDIGRELLAREGDDTPKFDPNAKQPEMAKPNLPMDISDISIEVPK